MKELELLTVLKSQLADTIKYANDTFNSDCEKLLDSYEQELYGNEDQDHSQVVASDHYELVESDMPAYARVFLGSGDIMKFIPFGPNDVQECEEKTKYANYLIRCQRDSFKILHDLLKEPGFSKCSVAHYYIEDVTKAEYVRYENLTDVELAAVMKSLESEKNVEKVEVESRYDADSEDRFSVRFRVIKKTKKTTITPVKTSAFIISRGSSNKDSATIVGHVSTKSKGQLIAEGYTEKLVKSLPCSGDTKVNQSMRRRFLDQGGYDYQSGYHWTNDLVTVESLYALVDYDEDGIPERRFIQKVGDKILQNEPFSHVPYAIFSQILMPHSAIGKSRGEQAARIQKEKTAIKRGLNDNIYAVNRPRFAVDDSQGSIEGGKVDLDDLLDHKIGGVVRTDGPPMNAIFPLEVPYIGDKALQIIQYLDAEKANTLGVTMASQGLTADKFHKETATRFDGIQDANLAKTELVCRVYAETGFRELYEGVIWLAQHFQDSPTEIMVLGKQLTVDPTKWKYEHYCQSQVGLAAGDSGEAIQNLSAVLSVQQTLAGSGSVLVDAKKLYNTMDDMVRVMGKPDTSRYFNDPEQPQQLLMAQVEQLTQALAQMQQQLQSMANPLADVEMIKAKARLAEADAKQSLESEKLALENKKTALQHAETMTELELKYSTNVPGSAV